MKKESIVSKVKREEEMERKARDNEKMRGTDKQNNPRNSIAIYEDGRGMEGWHRTGTQDK